MVVGLRLIVVCVLVRRGSWLFRLIWRMGIEVWDPSRLDQHLVRFLPPSPPLPGHQGQFILEPLSFGAMMFLRGLAGIVLMGVVFDVELMEIKGVPLVKQEL